MHRRGFSYASPVISPTASCYASPVMPHMLRDKLIDAMNRVSMDLLLWLMLWLLLMVMRFNLDMARSIPRRDGKRAIGWGRR